MIDRNRRGDWSSGDRDDGAGGSGERRREARSFTVERDRADPRLRPEDVDAREGFDRYGVRGEKDYRGEVYRARDVDESPRGDVYGYGRDGGVVGANPALDRVVDDPTGRGWREDLGRAEGPHRGRGPKTYVRSDARIREDVSERLSEASWLDASEIEVEVQAAEVTLTGLVRTRDDRRRAEDLAWDVSGVKHVQNNLRVQAAETAASPAIPQDRPA